MLIAKKNPVLVIIRNQRKSKFKGHVINILQDINEISETLPNLPNEINTSVVKNKKWRISECFEFN